MSLPRLSVRAKILGTVAIVATIVLALGAFASYNALLEGGRGRYLNTHFGRFRLTLEETGQGDVAGVRLAAGDPGLRAGIESGEPAQVTTATARLSGMLFETLAPDLIIITDRDGSPIKGKGVTSVKNYRATRLFQDLRGGGLIRNKLAVIDGTAYRVSGSPIHSTAGKEVIGTLLVAQRLERFLERFAENSMGKTIPKRHRVTLIGVDSVLASAMPKGERAAMLEATQKAGCNGSAPGATCARPPKVPEHDEQVPVLKLNLGSKSVTYDYWDEPAFGYLGAGDPATTRIGTFFLVRTRSHIASKMRSAEWDIALMLGIAALIALIFGTILSAQITRPLRSYILATSDLAEGKADLSQRLPVKTRDELGVLAENLNRVFAKIQSLAQSVQQSAFQVGASSGEISSVSKQMLDGAKEQAGKISNSTAAVVELSSSIQQVAENAAAASKTAKSSGAAVTDAVTRLEEIRRTVEDAAGRIATLGESGKRIGNIVEVIRQISEQTTMLALNAAIEAAHAGEHGRGFAVVADEVSSLAKRVGQSARDIEDLIATIRDQTGEAVRVMEDGSRDVEEGTGLVTATLGDLQTLVDVIDDTAGAVQEQAIASDEIARNMDVVQRIATNVLSSSENAVAQGDRLLGLAEGLESSVRGFKTAKAVEAPNHAELPGNDPKALTEGNS